MLVELLALLHCMHIVTIYPHESLLHGGGSFIPIETQVSSYCYVHALILVATGCVLCITYLQINWVLILTVHQT